MNYSLPKLIDRWLRTGETVGPESPIKHKRRNPFTYDEWFVDGQNGSDSASGLSPDEPLKTIGELLSRLRSNDVAYLTGNFAEEAGNTPKNVENVSFIGMSPGRPKYADAARDADANQFGETDQNGGCSWRPPATESGTTPLITVVHQGWTFQNIFFVPPTDAAAVAFDHSAVSGADDGGASYITFRNCIFEGGHSAIDIDEGGVAQMLIEDCVFSTLTSIAINQATETTTCQRCVIRRCYFMNNDEHISIGATDCMIHDNLFGRWTTDSISLNSGSNNLVTRNYLWGDYSTSAYVPATSDEWTGNFSQDTAQNEVADNGITVANPSTPA